MAKRSETYPTTIILPIKDNPVWNLDQSADQYLDSGVTGWRAWSVGENGRNVGTIIKRMCGRRVGYGELLGTALKNYFNGGIHGEA